MEQLNAYRHLIELTAIRCNDAEEYLQNLRQAFKRLLSKNEGEPK